VNITKLLICGTSKQKADGKLYYEFCMFDSCLRILILIYLKTELFRETISFKKKTNFSLEI